MHLPFASSTNTYLPVWDVHSSTIGVADTSASECGVIGDVSHISEPVWGRDSDRCLALSWLPDQPHCLAAASGIKATPPRPPPLSLPPTNPTPTCVPSFFVSLILSQTIKLYDIRQGTGSVPQISSGSTMVAFIPFRHPQPLRNDTVAGHQARRVRNATSLAFQLQ